MARRTNWSDEELAELAQLTPYATGATVRFHEAHPHRSLYAIRAKLQLLRQRGQAQDIPVRDRRRRKLVTP